METIIVYDVYVRSTVKKAERWDALVLTAPEGVTADEIAARALARTASEEAWAFPRGGAGFDPRTVGVAGGAS